MDNEIVAVQPVNSGAVAVYDPFGTGSAYWCSLQPQTQKDRIQLINLLEGTAKKLSDAINTEISIVHVLAHQAERQIENGEIEQWNRTVILDENGQTWECGSAGIARSLGRIFQVFGTPATWKEPFRVKVQQLNLPGGKRFFKLEPVFKEEPKAKK